MFRVVLIVVFLLINLQTIAQQSVVLGFYNLENLFDTLDDSIKNDEEFTPNGSYAYTDEIFQKKLSNLAEVIAQMGVAKNEDGAAILGVAEVENRFVLEELAKQKLLRNRNYQIVHFESPDNRGIDVGLLFQPKYFRLLAAQPLTVSLEVVGDSYPTRDILYVKGRLMGEMVHIFVNHWPSRRGGEAASREKRNEAARVCIHFIDSLRQIEPNIKTIVMGDLNDDPINESVTTVLKAKGSTKNLKANMMYNPWLRFYKQGIGTIAYQDTWGLFDQIIMSPAWVDKKTKGLKFYRAEVFNNPFLIQKDGQFKGYPKRSFSWGKWNDGYSDHFPTLIYLR